MKVKTGDRVMIQIPATIRFAGSDASDITVELPDYAKNPKNPECVGWIGAFPHSDILNVVKPFPKIGDTVTVATYPSIYKVIGIESDGIGNWCWCKSLDDIGTFVTSIIDHVTVVEK